MRITLYHEVTIKVDGNVAALLESLVSKVDEIDRKVGIIMPLLDDYKAALDKIDATTTEAAEVQGEMATALQEASDDIDKILAQAASGTPLTPELVSQLQSRADRVSTIADTVKAHAAFSRSIAAKYTDPVPVPVPELPPLT